MHEAAVLSAQHVDSMSRKSLGFYPSKKLRPEKVICNAVVEMQCLHTHILFNFHLISYVISLLLLFVSLFNMAHLK